MSRNRKVAVFLFTVSFLGLYLHVHLDKESESCGIEYTIEKHGNFLVSNNFIRATKKFAYNDSITLTTTSDFRYLHNLLNLTRIWSGPISVAVYSPGTDFKHTIQTILHLRECLLSNLIKELVTFHLYFDEAHKPDEYFILKNYRCPETPPWLNKKSYRVQNQLKYYINVGRNIARENAQTHYVFASDIELRTSKNFIPLFMDMIRRNNHNLTNQEPKIFVLPIFEVQQSETLPETKSELLSMIASGKAAPFHVYVCEKCHKVPGYERWKSLDPGSDLNVLHVTKRREPYNMWEPLYVGTNDDPWYDERLTWEGEAEKLIQMYEMCLLDYEFHILDNAFLVHESGVSFNLKLSKRVTLVLQHYYIRNSIMPELRQKHGSRDGCELPLSILL